MKRQCCIVAGSIADGAAIRYQRGSQGNAVHIHISRLHGIAEIKGTGTRTALVNGMAGGCTYNDVQIGRTAEGAHRCIFS